MFENFVLPSDEERKQNAIKWVEETVAPFAFENWSDEIKNHHFIDSVVSVEFPFPLIEDFLNGKKNEEIIKLGVLIENCCSKLGEKLFCKLSSRSPKDFMLKSIESGELEPIDPSEVLVALGGSMRTFEDLARYSRAEISPMIHIMPFVDIDHDNEYRGFFIGGKLMALSRYHYYKVEKHINDTWSIISLAEKIAPHLPIEDCVVDFYIDNGESKVVELNPMGLSDPCLFTYDEIAGLTEFKFKE